MTHTLKRTFAMLLLAIFGSAILYNCEPDPDSLGEQLFNNDAAQGDETSYDVIAYNIDNHDSIRSDASRLISSLTATGSASVGVLGAFNEPQFGMQKASYVTQFRMPTDNFDFNGPNAKVDSVVLVVRPPANTVDDTYYITDSIKAPGAYDRSDYPVGDEKVEVSIDKKIYPIRKYGKIGGAFKSMKINVEEITTFLDTNTESFTRSNANVNTGAFLGSGVFDGNVSTVTVTKKSDNTNLFTGNLGFRINLSNTDFFQKQVIDKKGKPELQDAANFIRHIKGLKISVEQNDGYLFQFSPDDTELIMYYKYDKTDNGTVTHPQTTLKFNLGSSNAHLGLYEYNRSGSKLSTALGTSDPTNGDPKLFVQGMGGPSVGVKIPDAMIAQLKELYQKDKIGIVGAKIRFYVDPETWTNTNSVAGDRKFTLVPMITKDGKIDLTQFTSDALNGFNIYTYNSDKNYYDFVITKTLKDIIEEKTDADGKLYPNNPLLINLGAFIKNAQGTPVGAKYTTRASDMNRAILVGTTKDTNPSRVQLKVTYAKKK